MTGVCPDCRCALVGSNQRAAMWGETGYCDYCLVDRAKAGEHIPTRYDDPDQPRFVVLCQRCGGSGEVILTAWQEDTRCFRCSGFGVVSVSAKEVQRMQRWSGTFQANRVPRGHRK